MRDMTHVTAVNQYLDSVSLDDRYRLLEGRAQLTGVQALARLVLDQIRHDRREGRDVAGFISGYEGSPLGGYDLELMRHKQLLEEHDLVLQPGLNEEAGAMAVQGSQLAQTLEGQRYDGVFGVWYGKAPGLDRAKDALRHANLMGTAPTGGVLCLVGDDPAAKSSSVPCASEVALADLRMPILYPADSQEVLDLGRHGIALSRACGLWTGFKVVTAVADGSSTVDLSPDRVTTRLPHGSGKHLPTGKLLQPTLGRVERDQVTTRMRIAAEYGVANGLNRVTVGTPGDTVGIVASGKSYLDLRQALGTLGLDDAALEQHGIRLLKISMPWPLHPDTITGFAEGLDEVVVVEEKRSFLEAAVKEVLYGRPGAPVVTGKRTTDGAEQFPEYGDLDVDVITRRLATRLERLGIGSVTSWLEQRKIAESAYVRTPLPLLQRAPYFCSGCPHNTSTKPHDASLVGAGIGCHAMVLLMDSDQVGDVVGLTQMGGEGTQWIGMAPFLETEHFVQNLGDGTWHHSGSLAIRAAVAAGVDITYKLLHNSTVAMTGGQDAVGAMPVPRLVASLLAEGVARVLITADEPERYRGVKLPRGVEVWPRSRFAEAQSTLAATPGVTVLLHDQECAAQKRRKRKRGKAARAEKRIVINERICEGCGDCGQKSNCLSVHPVETEFGRKTRIHQASCNTDYTCVDGDCPAFMVVEAGGEKPRREALPALAADTFPAPTATVPEEAFGIRITGIGGTGVVTVSAVLGMAGVMAGRHVRTLDQTGLSQKGGAVVSDLKVSTDLVEEASKIAPGECDLYLGADALAAASEANLDVASRNRTVAVISTTEVPTGQMVSDASVGFPTPDRTLVRIDEVSRGDVSLRLDARGLAEEMFGGDQFANMLLVGAAYQAGALPLPAEAIEAAITLNGAAVDTNIQAFRRGRQFVADRPALERELAGPVAESAGPLTLDELVAHRRAELVAYQDERYAASYAALVERVRLAEQAAVPGSTRFTESVARHLHKLMAYKDEYEVARLARDPEMRSAIEAQFGEASRASWKLHPPTLKALGMDRKLTLGAWFAPVLALLARMSFLRGTPLDPFGRAEVRRVERRLAAEYREVVESLLPILSPDTVDRAAGIAALPDMVRGYEDVKLRNVAAYDAELAARLAELRGAPAGV
jgi:indolepyruvate ferredoxin oxidoreductase